jgi:hypothetical protein
MAEVKPIFVRPLFVGVEKGTDIQGTKRALSRVGCLKWAKFDNNFYKSTQDAVKKFQKKVSIDQTGRLGEKTFNALAAHKATADHPGENAFDEYANELCWAEYEKRREDPALRKARELLGRCKQFSGPYLYGGGHGTLLAHILLSQGLDCSSSSSKGTFDEDLFEGPYATNSTGFESYGESGRGKYVTIHANSEHVWIEFTLPEGWFRFDTSPHGCGSRGPRVRTCRRYDSTFVHRHPPGL